jgi:hypothetical protein
MSKWRIEFGESWDVPSEITDRLMDISWHNDTMPSFAFLTWEVPEGHYCWKVWVDHPDREQREHMSGCRFIVEEYCPDGSPGADVLETDDLAELLAWIDAHTKRSFRPLDALHLRHLINVLREAGYGVISSGERGTTLLQKRISPDLAEHESGSNGCNAGCPACAECDDDGNDTDPNDSFLLLADFVNPEPAAATDLDPTSPTGIIVDFHRRPEPVLPTEEDLEEQWASYLNGNISDLREYLSGLTPIQAAWAAGTFARYASGNDDNTEVNTLHRLLTDWSH